MSVLVAGQRDLKRRALRGPHEQKLLVWFASVEERAWSYVNAATGADRPDKIFLVTGQTLVSEYAISHIESTSTTCTIVFEANAGLPAVANAAFLAGHDVRTISASAGFEDVKRTLGENGEPEVFSVFLDVTESRPMKVIRKSTLLSRIREAYAYVQL